MTHTLSNDELSRDLQKQMEEALGDENRWYASEKYGRPVSDEEALQYYVANGGSENYRRRKTG